MGAGDRPVGGFADGDRATWRRDARERVLTTKGITAIARTSWSARRLELDAGRRYWPDSRRTAEIPAHAPQPPGGLAAVRAAWPEDLFDWRRDRALAAGAWWEPGTRHGYHALTYGWLVGELIRRVSGMSVGRYVREHIAAPLGADFWIGLPE
jgi:CubicO group peptidase (beta-lactamase class C family)